MRRLFLRGVGMMVMFTALAASAFAADGSGYGALPNDGSEMFQASLGSAHRARGSARHSDVALTDDEAQLYRLLMDYRREHGLSPIPLSPSLSRVAKLHVRDLEAHPPSGSCNLHSWSEYGSWTPVCYQGGESVARMWSKPRELTGYQGNGYEIAAATSRLILPDEALSLWEESSSHNAVMINSGVWQRLEWKAVGVAISGSYAVVWFGEQPDNAKK
jgi:hypothetical protein